MADYGITRGTLDWDVPLNSDLSDIDSRLTTGENKDTTQDSQISTLQTSVSANSANITTLQGQMTSVTTTANNAVPRDSQVVNVKDHGAVGDGVANDASAIATSIGLLTAGGVLYFPPGNYLINSGSSLAISQPVTILGAGPGASSIRIGSGFAQAQLFNVTSDNVTFDSITIRGDSTTTTSNPVADGVLATAVQFLKVLNTTFQWINGYALKAFASAANTIHGGQVDNVKVQSCAGGIYLKGDNASGNVAVNWQISDYFSRFNGVASGGSANLDGIRIEDAWDVTMSNVITWMSTSSGGTGTALRVIGNCAATFITNLDALGPTATGTANVSIENNANGSPQNVQITGGVIQQGIVGINIAGASTQVRVASVRFINNSTHGAVVSTTGPAVYFDGCFWSTSGAGATGTNYDLNWSGTSTGFVTNCRFASPIVAVNNAGVQFSVNVTAAQNVRFFNADFQGTGAAQANWFTNLPKAAHTVTGGNNAFLTDTDFNYSTGPGRVAIQPFAAGNNCLALNVQGNDANDRFRLTGDGAINIGPGNAARDTQWGRQGVANIGTTNSDITINLAGKTLMVKSGANAKAGTVTANGTTAVTVTTTAITANSVVVFGLKTAAGTAATQAPYMSAVTAGTSFQIKSSAGDTSVYNWVILDLI